VVAPVVARGPGASAAREVIVEVRISAIVDADFSVIADGVSA
jgi:hypothetical protein